MHPARQPRVDVLFELLSDARRRFLCWYLLGTEGQTFDRSTLAERIVEWEGHLPAHAETADRQHVGTGTDDRQEVEIELHHGHLPKLEEAGVLEYDPRSGAVRLGDADVIEDLDAFGLERFVQAPSLDQ